MVRSLLQKGANIDLQNTHGYTPLISAIHESRDYLPARPLCPTGSSSSSSSSSFSSSTSSSSSSSSTGLNDKHMNKKHMDVIHALINNGCNLNLPTNMGNTPLSVAYDLQYTNVVDALLAAGCALNTLNSTNSTVLHHAVLLADVPTVRKLLDRGADKDATDGKGWTPLDLAMLTIASAEPSLLPFATPLTGFHPHPHQPISACNFGGAIAATATTTTTDPSPNNNTVSGGATVATMATATWDERLEEIMAMLITRGCSLERVVSSSPANNDTNPMLDIGIMSTSPPASSSLSAAASTSTTSSTNLPRPSVLSIAYRKYRMKIVHLLLSSPQGCPLNALETDYNGDTVLHLACARCDEEFVKTLITSGADVNVVNIIGTASKHPLVVDNQHHALFYRSILTLDAIPLTPINHSNQHIFFSLFFVCSLRSLRR